MYGSEISANLNSVLGLEYDNSPCDGYPDRVSYNREDIESLAKNGCEVLDRLGYWNSCIGRCSSQEFRDLLEWEDEYNEWYDRLKVEIWDHERENGRESINIWYKYEDDCGSMEDGVEEPAFWMIINGRMDSLEEVVNRCLGCGVNMGHNNPMQYCMKTYCPSLGLE